MDHIPNDTEEIAGTRADAQELDGGWDTLKFCAGFFYNCLWFVATAVTATIFSSCVPKSIDSIRLGLPDGISLSLYATGISVVSLTLTCVALLVSPSRRENLNRAVIWAVSSGSSIALFIVMNVRICSGDLQGAAW